MTPPTADCEGFTAQEERLGMQQVDLTPCPHCGSTWADRLAARIARGAAAADIDLPPMLPPYSDGDCGGGECT